MYRFRNSSILIRSPLDGLEEALRCLEKYARWSRTWPSPASTAASVGSSSFDVLPGGRCCSFEIGGRVSVWSAWGPWFDALRDGGGEMSRSRVAGRAIFCDHLLLPVPRSASRITMIRSIGRYYNARVPLLEVNSITKAWRTHERQRRPEYWALRVWQTEDDLRPYRTQR